MNILLTDALKQLDLQPGERRSIHVDDYHVVIERDVAPSPVEDEGPIEGFWLNAPLSPNAVTIVAKRGKPLFPAPIEISESDLAPE